MPGSKAQSIVYRIVWVFAFMLVPSSAAHSEHLPIKTTGTQVVPTSNGAAPPEHSVARRHP
jgi:hypothetical protein